MIYKSAGDGILIYMAKDEWLDPGAAFLHDASQGQGVHDKILIIIIYFWFFKLATASTVTRFIASAEAFGM